MKGGKKKKAVAFLDMEGLKKLVTKTSYYLLRSWVDRPENKKHTHKVQNLCRARGSGSGL